jgi:dTDP-glucose 4,6-dehydratase
MTTVLVTGGCGFIGSNFIRYVLRNRSETQVVNLDKLTYAGNLANLYDVAREYAPSRYRFVKGDIGDKQIVEDIFRESPIDWVVNFAAESHVDRSIVEPAEFLHTNILGTFTLLEAAKKLWLDAASDIGKKRFLQVSTDEVYGSLSDSGSFTEATPYDPSSPYSASKAASDHLTVAYCRTYSLPVIITNCSNNYGPYQFPEKLIPLMISNAVKGRSLPVYGDGKNVRDWLYVEDHCAAILSTLEKGRVGEKYNIGGNCEKQNIEVVTLICDYLDKRLGLIGAKPRRELIAFVTDRLGHDRRYAIDASKIRHEIFWEPATTFENGIARTIEWYLDNRTWVENIETGRYRELYRGE